LEVFDAFIELKKAEKLKIVVHGEEPWLEKVGKRRNAEDKYG
jgi:hypothetical protein